MSGKIVFGILVSVIICSCVFSAISKRRKRRRESQFGEKMEIDETIRRWFVKTNDVFKEPYDGEDLLIHAWCLASVALASNYFESTLILLNNERRLPARALLRILGEFIVKIVWCLKGKNESDDEVHNRFERWLKKTKIHQRKIRKEALKIGTCTEQRRTQLEELIVKDTEEIDKIKLPPFPSIRELFENIFTPQDSLLAHGGMYLQFLSAIHLDIIALEDTMDLTRFIPEGKVDCLGDTKDNIDTLKLLCLAHAHIFLTEVWDYFGLDVNLIKSDYKKLVEAKGLGNVE